MKIKREKITFNKGKEDEEEREMVVVDKEGYNLIEITEKHIGQTLKVAKKPEYYTLEQWKVIRNTSV